MLRNVTDLGIVIVVIVICYWELVIRVLLVREYGFRYTRTTPDWIDENTKDLIDKI